MNSLQDLLAQKAAKLDDTRRDDKSLAQQEVQRQFGKDVIVYSLKNGVLVLNTRSAPLASELRMQQQVLLETLNGHTKSPVQSVRIYIR